MADDNFKSPTRQRKERRATDRPKEENLERQLIALVVLAILVAVLGAIWIWD